MDFTHSWWKWDMHFVDIRFKAPRYCVNGGSTRPPAVGGGQVGCSANHGHASVGSRGKYKQCLKTGHI